MKASLTIKIFYKLKLMKLNSNIDVNYKKRDFFIVLFSVLLSKSLFYENFGNNLLLGAFLGYLILIIKPLKLTIKKNIVIYILFFITLITVNQETKLSSVIILLIRFSIAVYIVHLMSFKVFADVYIKIMYWVCLISLLYVFVIFFDIHSILPNFIGTDERPLRNFLFFGVSENFIKYGIYRNSGLWWEPGAYQIFVNLAFVFALVRRNVTLKLYIVLGVTIISTVSTTGILVFMMLSLIYWKGVIRESKNKIFYISIFSFFSVAVIVIGLPFILLKFGGGDVAQKSVSFLSRYYDFIISYNMFLENPIIGYGFGSQIENAIPYGMKLMGRIEYELIKPTGSDGLTMLIAQCGVITIALIKPLIYPKYTSGLSFSERIIICISFIIMFNTQNFVYFLIFSLLCFYGMISMQVKETHLKVK